MSGWDPDFVADLGRGHMAIRFVVESVPINAAETPVFLASYAAGGEYVECIDPRRSSISHGELQVPSWVRTGTSISLAVTADLRRRVRPGQIVRLRVGLRGRELPDFESVFVGAVRGLRWQGGLWSLQLVDLVYALQSRRGATPLFQHAVETTLSSAYSAGDPSVSVASTAQFAESTADGGRIWIEPDGGEPFLLTYTSAGGGTVSGCSALGVRGTTAVAAPSGSVARCAFVSDTHPLNTIRRLLVSTGAGTNGSRDVLPEASGYALPEELVAGHDIERHVAVSSPSSGSNDWSALAVAPVDDGLGYMQAFLAGGGFFLGIRQGRVTARSVGNPSKVELPDTHRAANVTVESYEAWDPATVEAVWLRWRWPDGTSTATLTEAVDTFGPLLYEAQVDLPNTFENQSGWASSLNDRLGVYLLRRAERLTVRQAGLALAAAAPGDCVELTTGQITSRYQAEGYGFVGRRTLCVGGGPDWFRGEVRLSLLSHVPGALAT